MVWQLTLVPVCVMLRCSNILWQLFAGFQPKGGKDSYEDSGYLKTIKGIHDKVKHDTQAQQMLLVFVNLHVFSAM